MFAASDPRVKAAQRSRVPALEASSGAVPAVHATNGSPVPPSAPRPRRRRVLGVYALLAAAALAVTLRLLGSALATPLEQPVVGAAPAWMVEVTTTSARPTTALVYGDEVGFQLVQIPAGTGAASGARIVPARLAKGELHIVSLGLRTLRVQASAPNGAEPMSFSATSPIVTAFQSSKGTGVRVGW